ncbi:hypothetical protein T4D_12589 [Trichinella pseudospiralis]|uniref:Uncharacterized protein n=1 Tax=Trichinella pseudospiralis TaxID=6337 RepID=A0A0V1FNC6_TRIPS|nr:hypothetical protein T4D_12589 [Trichinella pseudospiralis]
MALIAQHLQNSIRWVDLISRQRAELAVRRRNAAPERLCQDLVAFLKIPNQTESGHLKYVPTRTRSKL